MLCSLNGPHALSKVHVITSFLAEFGQQKVSQMLLIRSLSWLAASIWMTDICDGK